MKSKGPSIEPCGTQISKTHVDEVDVLTLTLKLSCYWGMTWTMRELNHLCHTVTATFLWEGYDLWCQMLLKGQVEVKQHLYVDPSLSGCHCGF